MATEESYKASHVANCFLMIADDRKVTDMTPIKLLKLVYFSYAWYLATYEEPLFEEKIEAWKYGPVIPSLYHEFKRFGPHSITGLAVEPHNEQYITNVYAPIVSEKDDKAYHIIDHVWNAYGNKTGFELVDITHEDSSAWKRVYKPGLNCPLNDEDIITRANIGIEKYVVTLNK
jgi:uncharacterized phage-associated protein